MARIQKKKAAHQKKKKQDVAGSEAVITAKGNVEATDRGTSVSMPAAGVEKKKKKVLVSKRTSGSDQSAVLRIAEKYFGNWIQFFREVKIEMIKVAWPTKNQTIGSTAVVIVFVFIIAFFLGIADIGLTNLIRLII